MLRGFVLVLPLLFAAAGYARAAEIAIYRDRYGVPSICADQLQDAVYAFGYVTCMDCAEQMARNYRMARGRLAEVDGPGAILQDSFLRAVGFEEIAERRARALSGEQAVLIRAYCDGANRALEEQKGKVPAWIEPVTPTDVLALAQFINAAFPLLDVQGALTGRGMGSNQFVAGPKRTANGHAILSIDPHLSWSGPMLWYEFALYTRTFAFHGITSPGLPFGAMGHTNRVAWCMTNNNPSLYALYMVQSNPANPREYSYHGEWRDFQDSEIEVRYLQGGEMKVSRQRVRKTAWGPMMPFRPWALKLSMLDHWEMLDQALSMMRARNAREFRQALRPLGLAMWNIAYADTAGHIGYQFNARVPRRDASFDWSKPVPGDSPKTRWGDPWTLDELPHSEDPASGLVVNANSAPWLTTLGPEIAPGAWPDYVTSYGHTTRYDRLAGLLSPSAKLTVNNAKEIATDTQVPFARAAVDRLRTFGDPAATAFASWDCRASLDSRGCALYFYWLAADPRMGALARQAGAGIPWTGEEMGTVKAALSLAEQRLEHDHGRLDIAWGDVHVMGRGGTTVPTIGFRDPQHGEIAAVAPNSGPFRDGIVRCDVGSSFRMIVELDPKNVKSWSVLPYGDSHNPASPHFADQMAHFGRGQYKDTFFGLKRIQKEAVSKQELRR